ncbi:MAG: type II toxin-antitoxin system VapC family toxin [Nitrospirota bacterium]|nr:type II toxin-antitoxin system VapC family toxin [Nitrospirota bacterium]
MASLYIDTSALVKYYFPESDSDKIESAILSAEHIVISWLTTVELASALSRRIRTGELTKRQETLIWNAFQDDLHADKINLVAMDDRHYRKAADLIRDFGGKYGLKTLDALHLAVAHSLPHGHFLCSDKVLNQVAVKMGMKLFPI